MDAAAVARYIIAALGPMSAMKLQKLVYYCQCWSLVWDERPLFEDRIEAWANGPVVPSLYARHKGSFMVSADMFRDAGQGLDDMARETIDAVLQFYGHKKPQWLSELTHQESPWKEARGNLKPDDRSTALISHAAMAEYYGSL